MTSEESCCGADGTQEQSPADLAQDERIRAKCWIETVGGRKKGRLYGAGQLVAKYTGSVNQQNQLPSSSSSAANTQDLSNIRQELAQTRQENEQLRSQFESLQSLVLQYLPQDAHTRLQQTQPQQPPQQPPQQQPQPDPQQQNDEEDDDNDINEDFYDDY